MAELQNPFLRGLLASQAAGERSTANQIGALSGLLSMQDQVQMAPIRREMAQLQLQNARLGPQPKWQVAERFDDQGRKVKVLVDLNNPGNVMPFGGAEARPLMQVPGGNVTHLRDPISGEERATPIPLGVSPNTAATLAQGQQQFNQTFPLQQLRTGADVARLFYDTGMGPAGVPGGNLLPPPMSPQSAPAPSPSPQPPIAPTGGWQIPPAEQARRDADARRIVQAENNGGAGMIPTRNVIPDARVPTDPIGQQIATTRPQPALTPRQQAERAAKAPERIQSVRKEFDDVPEVKNYRTVVPIIESARNAPDTPAGDLDLIYAVGKILDPTSVVREGEMNLVIKSGSPLQRVVGNINYIMSGRGRLPADQRAELTKMLDTRVSQLESGYNNAVNLFTRTAQAEGLPLDQIIRQPPQRMASDKGNAALEFNGYRFPSLEQLNAYKKAIGAP